MESFVPMRRPRGRSFGFSAAIRSCGLAIVSKQRSSRWPHYWLSSPALAGVIGTIIHDTETQNYLEQARTRHAVVATAVDDSKPAASPETTASTVHARWQVNGLDHADSLGWGYAVKAGDPLQIWVDDDGNRVDQPTGIGARSFGRRCCRQFVGWSDRGGGRGYWWPLCSPLLAFHAGRPVGTRDPIPCRGRRRAHQQFAMISFVESRP